MRKFLKVGLCGAAALMMFATGCSGQKSAKDASQAESTAEGETPAETEEYVAEGSITLGEYKGIPVTDDGTDSDGRRSGCSDSAAFEFER